MTAPTWVWILGSCVSRDAFNEEGGGFEIAQYWARTSLASAFCTRCVEGVELERVTSAFQRRMVEGDVRKLLPEQLRSATADVFLVDFIDERFDLLEGPDAGLCTLSNELVSSGFQLEGGKLIASGSDEFFARWERGWRALVAALRDRDELHKLRLHKTYWSAKKADGTGFLPSYPDQSVAAANAFLERLYARASQDVPSAQIIECASEWRVGALEHRWGPSPFHYVAGYYRDFMRRLRDSVAVPQAAHRLARGELLTPGSTGVQLRHLALGPAPIWIDLSEVAGSMVAVRAVVRGGSGLGLRRALVCMDFGSTDHVDLEVMELTRSHDAKVGAYRYLNTGPGVHETTFDLELPEATDRLRLGVRAWWPEDGLELEMLSVEETKRRPARPFSSVDAAG
jgi:hypothetical protein